MHALCYPAHNVLLRQLPRAGACAPQCRRCSALQRWWHGRVRTPLPARCRCLHLHTLARQRPSAVMPEGLRRPPRQAALHRCRCRCFSSARHARGCLPASLHTWPLRSIRSPCARPRRRARSRPRQLRPHRPVRLRPRSPRWRPAPACRWTAPRSGWQGTYVAGTHGALSVHTLHAYLQRVGACTCTARPRACTWPACAHAAAPSLVKVHAVRRCHCPIVHQLEALGGLAV